MSNSIVCIVKEVKAFEQIKDNFGKASLVVETDEKYPQALEIEYHNNNADRIDGVNVGDRIEASVNIRGREYNGRYYVTLVGWKIENMGKNPMSASSTPDPIADGSNVDDLPF